jgi:UDP-N-acetylmuramoylalanine--D-glutamate ligase
MGEMGSQDAFHGRRVLLLGLGRFTGGVETVRFLVQRGADVLVSDHAPREGLEASAREVEALGARLAFGPQTPAALDGKDLVVANPAVPFDHPVLRAADERGVPVTTEMNLFLEHVPAPVFGVTGTKGKSTTSTLLAGMLAAGGRRVHLGGNVGHSLLGEVAGIRTEDLVVLELSSFQLWWTRRIGRAPHVTLITNLFGDHLDRHGTFEEYAAAKRAALDAQGPSDVAVLPGDDADVRRAGYLQAGRARRALYGRGGDFDLEGHALRGPGGWRVDLEGFPLWGAHNRRNALAAAAAAAQAPGTTPEHVQSALLAARPLPHRLAPVAEVRGVLYVDDSNGTNPTSTLCALDACPRPAVVLVGGKDKGLDPTALLDGLVAKARAVVGIGTTGPMVVGRLQGRMVAVDGGGTIEKAVVRAAELARPGDAVLLSPAYSSLDEYPSFVVRGQRFQAAVRALAGGRP